MSTSILDKRITLVGFLKFEIFALIIVVCLVNFNVLPSAVTYVFDVVNIYLLVMNLKKIVQAISRPSLRTFKMFLGLFFAWCIASALINLVNPLWTAWELLQFFRLFIYLLLVVTFFTPKDINQMFDILVKLQIVNALFVLLEYFVLGKIQDEIGGMFGIQVGCNGPLNMYLVVMCLFTLCRYYSGRESGFVVPLLTCLCSCLIAAVAELKVFYIELVIVVILLLFITRPTLNTLLTTLGIAAVFIVGLNALAVFAPEHFAILTNIDSLVEYADTTNVTRTGYGISRLNPFSQITVIFFGSDGLTSAIGLGCGSAAMSSISAFCSDIYFSLGYLHYYFLQSAMLFIQLGYIGVALYALCSFSVWEPVLKKMFPKFSPFRPFAIILPVIFILNCMYNSTPHTYLALFWGFFFAAVFVVANNSAEEGGN